MCDTAPAVSMESWPRCSYRCHTRDGAPAVALQISESQVGSTGCRVWRAAKKLCRFLECAGDAREPWIRSGSKILELGAGCGLVGILCARLGAEVVITDLPGLVHVAAFNVHQNQRLLSSDGSARVEELCWGSDLTGRYSRGHFDLIVGSDLTPAAKWDTPLLLVTLLQLARPQTQILVSFTHRPRELHWWRQTFEAYFRIEVLPVSEDDVLSADGKASEGKDEFSLKYFDDSGEEDKQISILRFELISPGPSDEEIRRLLHSVSRSGTSLSKAPVKRD